MDIQTQENEKFFNDFINRYPAADARSLRVDIDMLRQQYPLVAQDLIKNPSKYYKFARATLQKNRLGDQKPLYEAKIQHYRISFQGNLGANFVTPRGLGSKMANQLVGIQGIITKMDIVKYSLEKSVHYCQKTKSTEVKEYPDSTNPEKEFEPTKTRFIKTHDENKNPLSFQYGLSSFRNTQTVVIQQLPEMAPPGLLPQSVNVILQGELVNSVKPGDRVQMIGIYKLVGGAQSKEKGIFKPHFICLSVKQLSQTFLVGKLPSILPFSQSQVAGLCSRSVAPSIYGHQQLKKAVLLMLMGGQEKNLDNGTHLRGDINVLMVGDPGTAKSQILRWVLSTAELAIGTTGSGASGVGLTAAIVSDKDTGEKTLQAGAMVLADRGVVCIDQFDKMNEVDRVAVHEVMEQQTVTIAKAGMHCSLNARCSVIAAANPIYGQYQANFAPTKNIGMPDSLLSRFDLVFIILDEKNAEKDKRIGERVCRNHRMAPKVNESYNQFNEDDDYIIHPNESVNVGENIIYEKNNIYQMDVKSHEILTQNFLKKYISHCRHNVHPQLSQESVELMSHMWTLLRQEDTQEKINNMTKALPVTIRSYETLIRISTAHAKLHRAQQVQIKDCVEAFKLMSYCLNGDKEHLSEKLIDIMRKLGHDESLVKPSDPSKPQKPKAMKKQTKKMEDDDTVGLINKIQKIDINKDEKEVEEIINRAIASVPQVHNDKKKAVFKVLVELSKNSKVSSSGIHLKDIRKKLDPTFIDDSELLAAIGQLETQGDISFETKTRKVYL